MDSLFLGGILVGFIAGVIVTLAFTTAHFLWVGEETKEADRLDYDMVVFLSVGYYLTKSDYDIQEKNIAGMIFKI